MFLETLEIKGFRQLNDARIDLKDATFLIGANNSGKSTALKALEAFLSNSNLVSEDDFFAHLNEEGEREQLSKKIVITGDFTGIPLESENWRGFKGRLFDAKDGSKRIKYRKTWESGKLNKPIIEMLSAERTRNEAYSACSKAQDFIEAGIEESVLQEVMGTDFELAKKLKDEYVDLLDDVWDINENEKVWIKNPGGIPQNVISRLPKFIYIHAEDKADELDGKSGALTTLLNELFSTIRDESENYKKAQEYLQKLQEEFTPDDEEQPLGKMVMEFNQILGGVFPQTKLKVSTDLQNPESLKPSYGISMESNIETSVSKQGTGSVRAAVFALLRYQAKRDHHSRSLIIGFEEPEIYLHPQAAQQMRRVIYDIAQIPNNQIICTTHSPYMIQLGRDHTKQSLNLFQKIVEDKVHHVETYSFDTSKALADIHDDDKAHVKYLLKVDDYVSKVFFAEKVLLIEGDTEEVVLKKTIELLPEEEQQRINSEWQIVKGRGKGVLISLIKYLKAVGISSIYVMHDRDKGTEKAEAMNPHIQSALCDDSKLFVLEECMEDVLGYAAPSSGNKPYRAYQEVSRWESLDNVPDAWREVFLSIFDLAVAEESADAA